VAIILVNWNGWRDTIECMQTCLALDYPKVRLVVCDNASTDESVENIVAWAEGRFHYPLKVGAPVTGSLARLPHSLLVLDREAAEQGGGGDAELVIVRTGANLGFAGGNNVGLRWAIAQSCDYAWLLNNDTVVPADTLDHLVDTMRADPSVGLCGSIMIEYDQPGVMQGYAGCMDRRTYRGRHLGAGLPSDDPREAMRADPAKASETVYPIGASILVSRPFLDDIGLMEEEYFLYYEEIDWVLRGLPRYRVEVALNSKVYHKVGSSAGSTPQGLSSRSVGYLYRSRLKIARRFARGRVYRVVLGIVVEAGRAALRGRSGRVIGALRALTGRVRTPGDARRIVRQ
jgi:hypothetical protein